MPPPVAQSSAALQACTHCTHLLSHCTDASTRHFLFGKVVDTCTRRGACRETASGRRPAPPRAASPPGAFNPRLQIYFYCGSRRPPRPPPRVRPPRALHTARDPALQPVRVRAGSRLLRFISCYIICYIYLYKRVQKSIIYLSQSVNSNFVIIK